MKITKKLSKELLKDYKMLCDHESYGEKELLELVVEFDDKYREKVGDEFYVCYKRLDTTEKETYVITAMTTETSLLLNGVTEINTGKYIMFDMDKQVYRNEFTGGRFIPVAKNFSVSCDHVGRIETNDIYDVFYSNMLDGFISIKVIGM